MVARLYADSRLVGKNIECGVKSYLLLRAAF